jgi:hypothetical protein
MPSPALRKPLNAREILELDAALMEAYRLHAHLRDKYPAASHILRPPVPAVLSESLVAVGAEKLFGPDSVAAYGGREADLRVVRGSSAVLVEVKATGMSAFQEIKQRDLARDYLVWVDFGRRYVDGQGAIDVHLLPDPARFTPPRAKITLTMFLAAAEELPGFETRSFSDLRELVGEPGA